jgi:hypothetical protein
LSKDLAINFGDDVTGKCGSREGLYFEFPQPCSETSLEVIADRDHLMALNMGEEQFVDVVNLTSCSTFIGM